MSRRTPSMQGQLLKLVLSLVAAMWLGTAALTWWDTSQQLDELLDSHLTQAAALLVVQQTPEVGEGDQALDAPVLHAYAPKVAFQVFHEGQLTLRSPNAPEHPLVANGETFHSGFDTVELEGKAWRVFTTYGSERDVQVYVGEALDSRSAILWAVLRSTLWPMLLALPLLALAIWWAVHRGMAPLRRLSQVLARRLPQDIRTVVLDDATHEMATMVKALNDLLTRIASLLESERRFTADAAHELRNPIAAIRAQAEVAFVETNIVLRQHALQQTVVGCDRTARLVDQLLTLSRLESGNTLPTTTLDFFNLTHAVVAELAPRAIQKGQDLSLDALQPCLLEGDDALLAALVSNLVDNAIRYSPEGAAIQVALRTELQTLVLCVRDSGPGMSESDLAGLGTRFFRVLGNAQIGSGLGWSIAARIATVHHGSLHATRCEQLGGLEVTVRFPVSSLKSPQA